MFSELSGRSEFAPALLCDIFELFHLCNSAWNPFNLIWSFYAMDFACKFTENNSFLTS